MRIGVGFIVLIIMIMLGGCGKELGLSEAIINEAVHSVSYAPLYVAIEKGYIKDEGLNVRLTGGQGAENTKDALLAGKCVIGILGTEVPLTLYDNNASKDGLICIGQLTQRAEEFLVSRDSAERFTWDRLKGKTVMNDGGKLPEAVLEYVLKKHGIKLKTELSILSDVELSAVTKEFTSGKGDYALVYEPTATTLELEGSGKVVAALGSESGRIPETAICIRKDCLTDRQEQLKLFMKGLQKGLEYVNAHSAAEIARVIKPQFSDITKEELTIMIARYQEQDTWKKDLTLQEGSFCFLQDILEDAGMLQVRAKYQELVNTDFINQ